MYAEEDFLPLSLLADLLFCERRAVLHLVENIWSDNLFTAEGTNLHHKVHEAAAAESRGDTRTARGLRLKSAALGLSGISDVVEFRRVVDGVAGVALPHARGRWRPFPVEYKHGRMRLEVGYEVQLCAQALCLEEMLGNVVPEGAVFYGEPRRRKEIAFTPELRDATRSAAGRLHALVKAGETPRAIYDKKCLKCSLFLVCRPKALDSSGRASRYREGLLV